MKYISTKEYNQLGPTCFRQWKADSHCNLIHGYSLSFKFYFESDTLDYRNWCLDYGGLKPLKAKLEEWFDHTLLVASDDPEYETYRLLHEKKLAKVVEVEKTGCEATAEMLYHYVNNTFLPLCGQDVADRVWCYQVEVRETDANMAMVVGHREDEQNKSI